MAHAGDFEIVILGALHPEGPGADGGHEALQWGAGALLADQDPRPAFEELVVAAVQPGALVSRHGMTGHHRGRRLRAAEGGDDVRLRAADVREQGAFRNQGGDFRDLP